MLSQTFHPVPPVHHANAATAVVAVAAKGKAHTQNFSIADLSVPTPTFNKDSSATLPIDPDDAFRRHPGDRDRRDTTCT